MVYNGYKAKILCVIYIYFDNSSEGLVLIPEEAIGDLFFIECPWLHLGAKCYKPKLAQLKLYARLEDPNWSFFYAYPQVYVSNDSRVTQEDSKYIWSRNINIPWFYNYNFG